MNDSCAPIKIAFLVRALDYGGAQRQLVTLAKALDKNRFVVTILTFYADQPLERELEESGVRFISLRKSGRWDVFSFFYRLVHELRLIRPDVVHGYLDIPNLIAILARIFIPVRVIWGIRTSNIDLENYGWLMQLSAKLERQLSNFPDLIIVNSRAGYERYVASGFPPEKMVVIPNGIDTEAFRPDPEAGQELRTHWGLDKNQKLVGIVGRLDPMKDHPAFLNAAKLLTDQHDEVRFVCNGSGTAKYGHMLRNIATDLGIADRILWTPSHHDMPAFYNALDVIVSSSCGEGFSNAIGEAMACGVPCVATDVGDSAFIVGDTGEIVPPRNPRALAVAIVSSLQRDRREVGQRSRTRIIENFSPEKLAEQTQKEILSLLKGMVLS